MLKRAGPNIYSEFVQSVLEMLRGGSRLVSEIRCKAGIGGVSGAGSAVDGGGSTSLPAGFRVESIEKRRGMQEFDTSARLPWDRVEVLGDSPPVIR